jgi:hypothetical protein
MFVTRSWTRTITALALPVVLAGCAHAAELIEEIDPPPPEIGPQGALQCRTDSEPSVSKLIGANGGSITIEGHRLAIRANALAARKRFVLEHPARDYVVVTVTPHGQTFNPPSTLTISYAHCTPPSGDTELAIHRWNGTEWDQLPSRHDRNAMTVAADLRSLSAYALASD